MCRLLAPEGFSDRIPPLAADFLEEKKHCLWATAGDPGFLQAGLPFERLVLSKEEALELFADNPFKVQLITSKVLRASTF